MSHDELTSAEQAEIDELNQAWDHHVMRTAVDMRVAAPRLREMAPPTEQHVSESEFEVTHTIDVSGIVETLRSLPDGAGTDAFVEAYNRRAPTVVPPVT